MTSAESTLLGIVIGAALAWLSSVLNSRTQWRREEQRRQRERRAELYQDMHTRAAWLAREQRNASLSERPCDRSPEWHTENDRWFARVALFASPEVAGAWETWFRTHFEGWEIRRNGLETPEDRQHYADQVSRLTAAHAALVEQMRQELDGRP